MSDERQHHLYSRLKQVSMTNWNYTDKFLIIHHKMTKISGIEQLDIGSYIAYFTVHAFAVCIPLLHIQYCMDI
jgi:hypothetical protein